MTFLEYVCEELIGPATHRSGDGESRWACPRCDHPGFHTRPHRPEYKDRFQCWSCGFWGDEFDLLHECEPQSTYEERRCKLARLETDWEARCREEASKLACVPSPGTGSRCPECAKRMGPRELRDLIMEQEFSPEADAAVEELVKIFGGKSLERQVAADHMNLAKRILQVCADRGLHPLSLVGRVEYEADRAHDEARHMMECKDPKCDYACCRLKRGWSKEAINRDVARRRKRYAKERAER